MWKDHGNNCFSLRADTNILFSLYTTSVKLYRYANIDFPLGKRTSIWPLWLVLLEGKLSLKCIYSLPTSWKGSVYFRKLML